MGSSGRGAFGGVLFDSLCGFCLNLYVEFCGLDGFSLMKKPGNFVSVEDPGLFCMFK